MLNRGRRRRPPRATRAALVLSWLLAVLVLVPAPSARAARGPYEEGDRIRLTGLVTEPGGLPIDGLYVALEVARSGFSPRHFRRQRKEIRRLTGLTNERGKFDLEWPWNSYFNDFQLVVSIPVRDVRGERMHELERIDLSHKIKQGSPVVSSIVVRDAAFVASLREFLASISSEDQRRTHQEVGEPDKVEQLDFRDHTEVAWWYFEAGKVYRFNDGKLERIEPFDPVTAEP